MIDSRTAAHEAFYAALSAETAVTDLGDVWSHPEEGTQPAPGRALVLLGLSSAVNAGGKDGGFDEVTIDIVTEVREPEMTKLYALGHAVRGALDGRPITATGAELSAPEFLSVEPDLSEDGQTYIDVLRFRTFVQPA